MANIYELDILNRSPVGYTLPKRVSNGVFYYELLDGGGTRVKRSSVGVLGGENIKLKEMRGDLGFDHSVLPLIKTSELADVTVPDGQQIKDITTGEVKVYNAAGAKWDVVSGGAGGGSPELIFMQALSNATQDITLIETDITSWGTAIEVGTGGPTINTTTGVVALNKTGYYRINCFVLATGTQANRVSLKLQMLEDVGSGFVNIPGGFEESFVIRNTAHNNGSSRINGYIRHYNNGDDFKIAISKAGYNATIPVDGARITVEYIGL